MKKYGYISLCFTLGFISGIVCDDTVTALLITVLGSLAIGFIWYKVFWEEE